jgi:hypothetical protein
MLSPHVVTAIRTKGRPARKRPSPSLWKLRREYFDGEHIRWFFLELLLFVLLAAISVWPMIHAIEAMRLLKL